jgi:hypothetical protein
MTIESIESLEFSSLFAKWRRLAVYSDLIKKPAEFAVFDQLNKVSDALRPLIDTAEERAREELKLGRYREATSRVYEIMAKAESLFSPDDINLKTAKIVLYRNLGSIYERWAASSKSKKIFRCAACCYMMSDLELGYIEDCLKVAICCGGTNEAREIIQKKLCGGGKVIVIQSSALFRKFIGQGTILKNRKKNAGILIKRSSL